MNVYFKFSVAATVIVAMVMVIKFWVFFAILAAIATVVNGFAIIMLRLESDKWIWEEK